MKYTWVANLLEAWLVVNFSSVFLHTVLRGKATFLEEHGVLIFCSALTQRCSPLWAQLDLRKSSNRSPIFYGLEALTFAILSWKESEAKFFLQHQQMPSEPKLLQDSPLFLIFPYTLAFEFLARLSTLWCLKIFQKIIKHFY